MAEIQIARTHSHPAVRFFRYSPEFLLCGDTAAVPPAAYFFCCARKSRQKDALETVLYCSLTRAILFDVLFGRKTVTFSIAFGSDIVYGFVGADAHIGPYKHIQ